MQPTKELESPTQAEVTVLRKHLTAAQNHLSATEAQVEVLRNDNNRLTAALSVERGARDPDTLKKAQHDLHLVTYRLSRVLRLFDLLEVNRPAEGPDLRDFATDEFLENVIEKVEKRIEQRIQSAMSQPVEQDETSNVPMTDVGEDVVLSASHLPEAVTDVGQPDTAPPNTTAPSAEHQDMATKQDIMPRGPDVTPNKENVMPDQESALTSEENAMASKEIVMVTEENAMADEDIVMARDENVMAGEDNPTVNEENVMASDENVLPSEENVMLSEDNAMPSEDNVMPSEENVIASKGDAVSTEQDAVAEGLNAMLSKPDAIANEQDTMATERDVMTSHQKAIPSEPKLMDSEHDVASGEPKVMASEQDATANEQEVMPSEDTVKATEQKVMPSEHDVAATGQDVTASEKDVMAGEHTVMERKGDTVADEEDVMKPKQDGMESKQDLEPDDTLQATVETKQDGAVPSADEIMQPIVDTPVPDVLPSETNVDMAAAIRNDTAAEALRLLIGAASVVVHESPRKVKILMTSTTKEGKQRKVSFYLSWTDVMMRFIKDVVVFEGELPNFLVEAPIEFEIAQAPNFLVLLMGALFDFTVQPTNKPHAAADNEGQNVSAVVEDNIAPAP